MVLPSAGHAKVFDLDGSALLGECGAVDRSAAPPAADDPPSPAPSGKSLVISTLMPAIPARLTAASASALSAARRVSTPAPSSSAARTSTVAWRVMATLHTKPPSSSL
jgi:hypothetical protein